MPWPDLLDDFFAEEDPGDRTALRRAGGAQSAAGAGEREQELSPADVAVHPGKASAQIAAVGLYPAFSAVPASLSLADFDDEACSVTALMVHRL